MKNITKLIPANIRIKSLYWVIKEKEINLDLSELFSLIDIADYEKANTLLPILYNKWHEISYKAPEWFSLEYMPKFTRAESMLSFLMCDLEEDE